MAKPRSVRGLFPVDILTSPTIPGKGEAANFTSSLSYNGKEADVLQCTKCSEQVAATRATVSVQPIFSSGSDYSVPSLYCRKCHYPFVGMHVAGQWWTVEEVLTSRDPNRQGFQKVETLGERLVLFVLNRVVYRCWDMDSGTDNPFLTHSAKEAAKLLWVDGKAVGFYTAKLKGTLCTAFLNKVYGMDLIDTIFIRKSHRNHGYGLQLLEDVLESHSEGNVGFSYPMSDSMYAVCYKYLRTHVEDRDYLWECLAAGDETQRANIWLQLHGQKKDIAQAVHTKISLTTPVNGDVASSDDTSMEVEQSAADSVTSAEGEVTDPEVPEVSQNNDVTMEEDLPEDQEEEQADEAEQEEEEGAPEAHGDEMEDEEEESQEEEVEVQVADADAKEEEVTGKDEEEVQEEETADEEVVEEAAEEEATEEEVTKEEAMEEEAQNHQQEEAVTSEEPEEEEEEAEEENILEEAVEVEEEEKIEAPEVLEPTVEGIPTEDAAIVENVTDTKDDDSPVEIAENGDEGTPDETEADLEVNTDVGTEDSVAVDEVTEDLDEGSAAEEAKPEDVVTEEAEPETVESPAEDGGDTADTAAEGDVVETEVTEQDTEVQEVVPDEGLAEPPAEAEEPVQYNDIAVEAEETHGEEKTVDEQSQELETAEAEDDVSEKPDIIEEASTSQEEETQVQELPTEPLASKENEPSGSKDQDSADSSQEEVEDAKQKRGRGRPRKKAKETMATSQDAEDENETLDKENTTDEEPSTGKDQETGDSSQDEETEELKKRPRRTPRGRGSKRRSRVTEDEENMPTPRTSKRRKV